MLAGRSSKPPDLRCRCLHGATQRNVSVLDTRCPPVGGRLRTGHRGPVRIRQELSLSIMPTERHRRPRPALSPITPAGAFSPPEIGGALSRQARGRLRPAILRQARLDVGLRQSRSSRN
ncbi:hypothetical protein GCM10007920_44670 [Ciceribacter naphthalenivorans]|uniref:Uncharacterized protein n=2 Tax=Alphaproteobacteria TaxID=28211 RepID=A0A512HFB9_9HYPH|nr:hypothetical protein RNA01_10690 [Ciceribacter naphthalenivorans]GLR24673.1 hypothetical protein GCM10007920_44670 [Ciceribacter naphthalenivorans]GLT07529.1 hypothetical protein GCM10007926_44670 [Sphingomonas psychrolutea]